MKRSLASLILIGSPLIACVEEPPRAPVTFEITGAERGDFLATPFPSDLLIRSDGRLDLRAFPNPFGSATLEEFLGIFEGAPAFAGTSTMAFRVEGGVDEATLPATPADSMTAGASMFVVELDSNRRLPIEWRHYPEGTAFYPPGTVAVNLLLGAVPAGPFALVITSAAQHADGTPLGPSPALTALMTCAPLDDVVADLDRPVDCAPYQALAGTIGGELFDIALINVITPQDSSAGLIAAYDAVKAYAPVVSGVQLRATGQNNVYFLYEGTIRLAVYQAGRAPYDAYDGASGGFVLDDAGLPVVQREEVVPFTLTVPKGRAMPAAGWPIAINGHGTGGDLDSGLGTRAGAEAFHLANAGTAMFAISEPLHRTRAGHRAGQEETLTFNFFNPTAGRDNWRQSALEKVMQVTALETMAFSVDGVDVRFDPANISYFGHSQGGIVGALFVGIEDRITGAFLSGAGAGFAPSLIEKTEPIVIADVLRLVLQIPDDEPIDTFHPVPAALQTFVDAADPLNYGRAWRHRSGRRTPHLVATSGLADTFTPKRNHAGLAGAFGLPLARPVAEPLPVLELLAVPTAEDVSVGNLRTDDDLPLTAIMSQYPADGHFAVFTNPIAQQLLETFFATLVSDGVPTARTQSP